jgi:2-oxoglutarate ferredoxin oxidoreductase subunit beta
MINQEIDSYINQDMLPYPFCPGCGHGMIVDSLNAALVKLQLDPHQVVIVTDIGCAGLSDKFFDLNALHGLHGRALTYASGIKLANPDLKVIVLVGDGGCGIGGNHLIHAARRNIGITVLVFNNLNYGMTGGQHSVTTPPGARTATTPYGNLEQPMDICSTVAVNGASFVARSTSFERDLPELIAAAIDNEGFSLIDIWELCTAYFVPNNRYSKKLLEDTMKELGFASGVLRVSPHPEYAHAYRQAVADQQGLDVLPAQYLQPKYTHRLRTRLNVLIAGAAGQRIGSAATALSRGAVLSGLWATQRSDYPVTVRTGYSLAQVVLDLDQAGFAGLSRPDVLVVLSEEGLNQVKPYLAELTEEARLYIESRLLPVQTRAVITALDFKGKGLKRIFSLMALSEVLRQSKLYPLDAFREAVALDEKYNQEDLAALDVSVGISVHPHP